MNAFDLRPIFSGLQLEPTIQNEQDTRTSTIQRKLGLTRTQSSNTSLRPTIECVEVCGKSVYII
jgi:hypothetical protein